MPSLKSFKESTDLPNIKGVYTLATLAKIIQIKATRTLTLKSFLSAGQRKTALGAGLDAFCNFPANHTDQTSLFASDWQKPAVVYP